MNLTLTPHPLELKTPAFWNGQVLRPIGKVHDCGGGCCGGFATAMAWARTGSVWNPSTRSQDVGTVVCHWHCTAFTTVPSRDGLNVRVLAVHTPSTMSPLAAFPVFALRVIGWAW